LILKLPKEINRKVRYGLYHLCDMGGFFHTHLSIFSYFGKEFFYFVEGKQKNRKINVYLVGNTDDSSILLNAQSYYCIHF